MLPVAPRPFPCVELLFQRAGIARSTCAGEGGSCVREQWFCPVVFTVCVRLRFCFACKSISSYARYLGFLGVFFLSVGRYFFISSFAYGRTNEENAEKIIHRLASTMLHNGFDDQLEHATPTELTWHTGRARLLRAVPFIRQDFVRFSAVRANVRFMPLSLWWRRCRDNLRSIPDSARRFKVLPCCAVLIADTRVISCHYL